MINSEFLEEFKALLNKYSISIIKNEDGCFLIDDKGVPILFTPKI